MPTGYTADVVDGKVSDLTSFALHLARGMGALMPMRDEAWNAPIPEKFEPSDYNAQRLAELTAERDRLYALTEAQADAEAEAEYQEGKAAEAKYLADKVVQRERYDAMIAKVAAWEGAPEGIKEFGLEQLRSGREFDCPDGATYYRVTPRVAGPQWRDDKLAELAKQIQYHAAEDAKERARTDGRNAWIAQLRKSLAGQPA